ncbi:MAG: EAL domain-containing protein [Geminicoccaceae bacterium]|nr:EAL domain-containing protein [Geminicoccaceae bacterium]
MDRRRFGVVLLAGLCFLAALVSGVGRLREQRALDLEASLQGGWFASRTEAHLLRFAAILERFAARGEPDRESFHEQVDVLLLAIRRLVREPDGARLMADPALAGLGYEVERRLLELEPALAKLEPGDEAAYASVRERLDEVGRPLAELVARAYDGFLWAAAASGRLATTLRRDLFVSLGLTGLSAVLLVGLVVSTVREARSARRRADRAASVAREAEDSLRTLVDALPVAVTAFDERGRVLLVNRHAAELAGIAEPAALGRDPAAIGLPAALSPAEPPDERGFREVELDRPDGRRRHLLATARRVLREDGSLARTVHIALDVTVRRDAEEQLRHLAEHDPLTGLANRSRFLRALEAVLVRPGARVALHLLDLDGFKEVNDSLGHPAGDRLLVAVAGRLTGAADAGTLVARLGGDEFALLQPDPPHADAARRLARRLVESLEQPVVTVDGRIRVGASVGIALAPEHGRTVDELLRHADIALYRAKAKTRASIVLFSGELAAAQALRHRLATALETALQQGALALHFQPIRRLGDGHVVACEALLRWPEGRAPRGVSTGELVAVAEETGLVGPLTEWVLRTACRQARQWQELGRPCPVAVNLSMTPTVLDRIETVVETALDRAGLRPELLELEVTESVLIRNFDQATARLERLRRRGIKIALDDFGTGYSALAYLQRFPLDKLKIDRRFTGELGTGPTSLAIVDAIVRLGHALGLAIVAEGVEREEQLRLLREVGCDQAQGFLLGRPDTAERVFALLEGAPPSGAGRAPARGAAGRVPASA